MALINKVPGATNRIDLIDLKTKKPLVLGWMDDIIEVSFGDNFYIQVHGNMQNTNPDNTVPTDVAQPTAAFSTLLDAKLIYKNVTLTHSSSQTNIIFGFVPSQAGVIGFEPGPFPQTPIFGTVGYADLIEALFSWENQFPFPLTSLTKIVQHFVTVGSNQCGGLWNVNSFGNIGGPIITYECDASFGPGAIGWTSVTTDPARTPLTTARALFWINQLIVNIPIAAQTGGSPPSTISYFCPGPPFSDTAAFSYFRTRATQYVFFWKVKNNKVEPQVAVTLGAVNPAGTLSINADIYTTGNPAGTVNISAKQVAQIAKFKNPALLSTIGISADNSTGLTNPTLKNGTFKFTTWRDPVKPPKLLFQGAHIKATPPIPSV